MKYGNITHVMVFANEVVYNAAMRLLKANGNHFEISGYPLALNFYCNHDSFSAARFDIGLCGIHAGLDYEIKYS